MTSEKVSQDNAFANSNIKLGSRGNQTQLALTHLKAFVMDSLTFPLFVLYSNSLMTSCCRASKVPLSVHQMTSLRKEPIQLS